MTHDGAHATHDKKFKIIIIIKSNLKFKSQILMITYECILIRTYLIFRLTSE